MRVVWTPAALERLDEIQEYIAKDSPSAAYRVAFSISTRADKTLSDNPFAGRVGRGADTREFVLGNIPYIVVYQVTDHVEILDVLHTSREWPESFPR